MTYTTEQLEQMLAAATPGPWGLETVATSCGVCHKIGPWPHQWRHGSDMSACIYDDYPPSKSGTANMLANATLIAAAPTVTAELIAARKRIAELEDALVGIKRAGGARMLSYGDEHSYYYHTAHAVLDATQ